MFQCVLVLRTGQEGWIGIVEAFRFPPLCVAAGRTGAFLTAPRGESENKSSGCQIQSELVLTTALKICPCLWRLGHGSRVVVAVATSIDSKDARLREGSSTALTQRVECFFELRRPFSLRSFMT